LIVKPAFKELFQVMDPAEVGAGLLLGVDGYVFIGHWQIRFQSACFCGSNWQNTLLMSIYSPH